MTYDLTLVTADPLPEPDPDLQPLYQAATDAGLNTRIAVWDDPEVDWSTSHLTLIRSTWDYIQKLDAFKRWIASTSDVTTLLNPARHVLNNLHKGYLLTFPLQGIPVIPTILIEQGNPLDLPALMAREAWPKVVVKPAVSAGSFHTYVLSNDDLPADTLHTISELLNERDLLIRPYLDSVDTYGERSLLFFDGQFSHCIRKHPRFAGQHEQITGPHKPSDLELDTAHKVLATLDEPLLYARVDLIRDAHDQPLLAELEIIEPSLFFRFAPEALPHFVSLLKQRLP